MAILLSVAVMVALSLIFAVWANDEANDARYRQPRFLGYCAAAAALAGLAVSLIVGASQT